jgi:hypothetical protein
MDHLQRFAIDRFDLRAPRPSRWLGEHEAGVPGPGAVAEYIRAATARGTMTSRQMGRRRISLGRQHDGALVDLAVRGRPVLLAGEPGTGKSWLAGLMGEQLILLGYCLGVLDPEGDYTSLESPAGVVVLGGDDPPPRPRDLARAAPSRRQCRRRSVKGAARREAALPDDDDGRAATASGRDGPAPSHRR